MSVKYILAQAGAKMGLNPSATSQRTVLLRYLNEAAKELYEQCDIPGSLMEQPFKVNGDQTITCPSYVGKIRGAREMTSQITWAIKQMRPRYNQFNWPDMWRNLRLKNTQALMTGVTNQSFGVLTVPAVETPNITVTLTGQTATATEISEDIVMDAVSKTSTNAFIDYVAVKKDRVNDYDVTLSDVDDRVLTVIPNNQKEAVYQIIDVSTCPWLQTTTSTLDHYIELLYKKSLPWLSADGDEFPAKGFDNIIVNKMLQLWYEEQGKTDIAVAYDSKASRTLARILDDQNKATEDVVALVAHPHDILLPRIRHGRGSHYRGYSSRGHGY